MSKPKTLNELRHLEESGFGQRYPRHGLKLLHWFANECVYFDKHNMVHWQYDPRLGQFDIHPFKNRIEQNSERLLPENRDYSHYEVGNLSGPKARNLPVDILEDYNQNHQESNMDRIIFSVCFKNIDRVYVTEHSDQVDFNKEATYEISRGLIMIIKGLTLKDFLEKTGYNTEGISPVLKEDDKEPSNIQLSDHQQVDPQLNSGSLGPVGQEDNKETSNIQLSDHQQVDPQLNSGGLGPVVEEDDKEPSNIQLSDHQQVDPQLNFGGLGPVVEEDDEEDCFKCIIL